MSVSVKDVAARKYWIVLLIITVASMTLISESRVYPEHIPESWVKLIISVAATAKYIGILLVLVTSVTWKWRQNPNPNPITPKYQKNLDETPDEHINRKTGFAIGVLLTIYGVSVEFMAEITLNIIPQFS